MHRDGAGRSSRAGRSPGTRQTGIFTYFSGTPIDILKDEVHRLPRDTVIFVLAYVLDSSGTSTATPDVVSMVSRAANAPVFGFYDTLFGHGLLGGHLVPFEKQGRLAGEMAVRVLHGKIRRASPLPGADSRAHLRLEGAPPLADSGKPAPGRERQCADREPNLWDLYKYYFLGGIGLVLVQSLLIVKLLVDRRRRRRAEAGLTENLRFEQVLSALSSHFVAPPHGEFDRIVVRSLREIAEVLGFQRAGLFQFSRGGKSLLATHLWSVAGMETPPKDLRLDELPWIFAHLEKDEAVKFCPPRRIARRGGCGKRILRPGWDPMGIVIPLAVGGSVLGAVMFGCVVREQPWSETIVQRLHCSVKSLPTRSRGSGLARPSTPVRTKLAD